MTESWHSIEPVHALLADGSTARIRPVAPGDREQILHMYEEMSTENQRLRFFGISRSSGSRAADRACAPARPGRLALLAEIRGEVAGLAEYERAGQPPTAEIALAVCDGLHHRGIGTLLLEHLVSAARAEGITAFTADALAENHEVLKVLADLGLHTDRRFDGPEVHYTVRLAQEEPYLTAMEGRGSTADLRSMSPLLRPRSIVVVGADRTPGSTGRAVLRKIRSGGFTGRLYAVNPPESWIEGMHAHPTVAALPEPPDLAVLAGPAFEVPRAAEECGAAGVKSLAVVTGGLDAQQSQALLAACRSYGMRLIGPGCLGVANTEDGVRLDATCAAARPEPATAGVGVQSGGIGIALLGGLARLGIGVSSFVALGNKYDISGNDLLQWWEGDGRTDLALLHLESFGNPRAFSRTTRRVARRMPVLTVDAGRTEAGRRMARNTVGNRRGDASDSLAGTALTRRALFLQAGITATRSVPELLEAAALLHAQPLPPGRRVAIVTNAVGAGVLAADACVEAGLAVPPFGPGLVDDLLSTLPDGATATNPVSLTGTVTEEQLRACLDRLAAHGGVDALLVALVPTAAPALQDDALTRAVVHSPGRHSRATALVRPAQDDSVRLLTEDGGGVPAYADPQAAARALAHAADRSAWLARPPGTVPVLDGIDGDRATALVESFLVREPTGGWLDPRTCGELLGCYGIPQLPWGWAETEDEAVLAAERLRGPDGRVVVKAYWPGLVHKNQQRAVHLDLQGDAQVRAAYRDFDTRFGHLMTGVVVQPLAEHGIELSAGVVQDDVFGPLVLFGLGGTASEVLADRAARLSPLTTLDVHDLITAPRCAPLLFGADGAGPVDLDPLEELLLRLSKMADDLPQLSEVQLDPVRARPDSVSALDARVRLVPRHPHDPYLRRLR
ncbi:GNAT family N-acetyltransferase [Streptomyces sp. NBC_00648]|uniref:bifunctional acetate--CoA ligase family protein/GNAT family N-acetyltransferase n=1 Tax=Streptomyces sp. NBC_00648 TaxID=2975797 RepID=UPI003245579C